MSAHTSMHGEWNKRAEKNAYHWVVSSQENWDKDAYYREGDRDIAAHVVPLLKKKQIDPTRATALDIGCGTGRLCRALAAHFHKVIGIDISDVMIEKAKADNAAYENIDFVQTQGSDLGTIDDESVDFVFSFLVFQHIPDRRVIANYFREIQRVVRPGGHAKFQVRGTPGNPCGRVLWFKSFSRCSVSLCLWRGLLPVPWVSMYNTVYGACFTKNELSRLLRRCGLTEHTIFYEQGNPQHLWTEVRV